MCNIMGGNKKKSRRKSKRKSKKRKSKKKSKRKTKKIIIQFYHVLHQNLYLFQIQYLIQIHPKMILLNYAQLF